MLTHTSVLAYSRAGLHAPGPTPSARPPAPTEASDGLENIPAPDFPILRGKWYFFLFIFFSFSPQFGLAYSHMVQKKKNEIIERNLLRSVGLLRRGKVHGSMVGAYRPQRQGDHGSQGLRRWLGTAAPQSGSREINAVAQSPFSFLFSPGCKCLYWFCPQVRWIFPPLLL